MAIRMAIDNGPGIWKAYIDDSFCLPKSEVPRILKECSRVYYEGKLKEKIKEAEEQEAKEKQTS